MTEDRSEGLLKRFLQALSDRITSQKRKLQDAELSKVQERLGAQDIRDREIAKIIQRRKEGKSL